MSAFSKVAAVSFKSRFFHYVFGSQLQNSQIQTFSIIAMLLEQWVFVWPVLGGRPNYIPCPRDFLSFPVGDGPGNLFLSSLQMSNANIGFLAML